jgi:hypothetical protein
MPTAEPGRIVPYWVPNWLMAAHPMQIALRDWSIYPRSRTFQPILPLCMIYVAGLSNEDLAVDVLT